MSEQTIVDTKRCENSDMGKNWDGSVCIRLEPTCSGRSFQSETSFSMLAVVLTPLFSFYAGILSDSAGLPS